MSMKIIKENKEIVYIKEKSKFIGMCIKVDSKDDILEKLNALKTKYSDATHICYAYILPDAMKYSDDKEPSKTAGFPILEVLQKNDLCYILGVVIRYFGGIKLGSNGLVRAYTKSISDTIINNTKEIEEGYLILIEEEYSKKREIDYLLKNSQIIEEEYHDRVKIKALVNKKTLECLSSVNYQIIKEVFL